MHFNYSGTPLLSLEMWESHTAQLVYASGEISPLTLPSFSISMVGLGLGCFLHITANKPYRQKPESVQAEACGKIL